jgi:DNA-directed RNA polymerase subunit RPC12/RpoP
MAITFHCNHCGKKIEAIDSAGGKWGKCPACHNRVYVPLQEIYEELKLAPVDESEEQKRKRLLAETHQLTQDILKEKEIPPETAEPTTEPNEKELTENKQPASWSKWAAIEMGEKELMKNIIIHLRLMADGELDEGEKIVNLIAPHGPRAIEILDRIALSEIPEPELADIPQQVLSGLIRTLRNKII